MLQAQTVSPKVLELIKKLQAEPLLASTRLVGGTALALQLAHRTSTDIDLFTTEAFSSEEVAQRLYDGYGMKAVAVYGKTVIGYIDGTKVDVIHHPYSWIEKPKQQGGIRMAGIRDIAAMKMHAIANSGTRPKDFVDIAYIGAFFPYAQIRHFTMQKYPFYISFTLDKAINYFEDVAEDKIAEIKIINGTMDWDKIRLRLREMLDNPSRIFPAAPVRCKYPLRQADMDILKRLSVPDRKMIILRNGCYLRHKMGTKTGDNRNQVLCLSLDGNGVSVSLNGEEPQRLTEVVFDMSKDCSLSKPFDRKISDHG